MSQLASLLTPSDAGIELSREEFLEAELNSQWRYERAEGRLVVMPPPEFGHHVAAMTFRDHLGVYRLAHLDRVEFVFQEGHTVVDDGTDRVPDIAVYLKSDRELPEFPFRAPDVVFEIVSPGWAAMKRDYEEKRDEYERLGVREYVIVDRFDHRLTVFSLVNGQYSESWLGPKDSYTSPLLPGLSIPLAGII